MPLPEKEFFTLDEIITRWRFAGCDHATLLDYARRDLLTFSVYLRDLGNHQRVRETEEAKITTTTTTAFSFTSSDYKWQSIRYLKSDDARRVLECREGESAGVYVLYSSPARNKNSGTGYLTTHYFTATDLVVAKNERDRFENVHDVNLVGGRIARGWGWLCDQTNQRPLTIFGGAVTALSVAGWNVYTWLAPK